MQTSFKIGIILFIFSELLFFISFFWTYLHYILIFSCEIGLNWPGLNLSLTNPLRIPLFNTLILLFRGCILSVSHLAKIKDSKSMSVKFLIVTICLGLIFTSFQLYEYKALPLLWRDGSYGSIFYIGTGFHGSHVILGSIILVCRLLKLLAKPCYRNSVLFDNSAWYWHFVDMIWIILFCEFYWWPYQF